MQSDLSLLILRSQSHLKILTANLKLKTKKIPNPKSRLHHRIPEAL